ncbi:hypothetical protein DACRYDRAFT_108625 [Dacryopinax primogenitus]|uniref:XLF-like N-terminal domain-containing protein n=1 Tax=Dacryopinax primogenitus (strain DJM 731) TaxID=1858805 RepID=M5FST0_DACPD|nr:uncharacterized protein DACRYDRAFT_108625 [Dacryopinax primogenitus]EJU00556.1 hypothetical protein DACRYDRAFT_108625 [Dacryopinax primogenitus]
MEFGENHEEALLHSTWQAIVDDESSTPYLFKFSCLNDDKFCCLLLTDTKRVWVEAMAWRHILRRAKRLHIIEEDVQECLPEHILHPLITLHSLSSADSLTPTFPPTTQADLLLRLSGDAFTWEWELEALPRAKGAELLSGQFIMPLLNWSGYVLDNYMEGITSEHQIRQLERDLDASGRTAKRHLHKMVRSVVRQPLFTTSLRRLTESGSGSSTKSAIFRSPEDEPRPRSGGPSPPAAPTPSGASRAREAGRRSHSQAVSVKEETPVLKAEPSSPAGPSGPSGQGSETSSPNAIKKEEEEEEEEEKKVVVGSETETEDEDEDHVVKGEQEDEDENKGDVKMEEEDADADEDEEEAWKRRSRVKREAEEEENGFDLPPSQSTRSGTRRKRASPSRKRGRRQVEGDKDVEMEVPVLKEESEEEKPVVKKEIFVPKSRVQVKRTKY